MAELKIGDKISRWTIIGESLIKGYIFCKCECGNKKDVNKSSLLRNKSKSCGCFCIEKLKKDKTKHGLVKHPLYSVWCDIKKRCNYAKNKQYNDYGGRGISVYNEWNNDFKSFYDWSINNGYKKGLQIDRINNNGNYEPLNCRYVSQLENANNKRNNCYILYNNIIKTAAEWSRETGIRKESISRRARKGLVGIEAIYGKKFCINR
jgi:hypothetical protein